MYDSKKEQTYKIQTVSAFWNASEWPIWKCLKWPTTYHQTNTHADTPVPVSGRKAYVGAGKEMELTKRPLQCCSWEMTLNITLIQVVISQLSSLLVFSHQCVFSYWSARMHGTDSVVYSVPCVPCSRHPNLQKLVSGRYRNTTRFRFSWFLLLLVSQPIVSCLVFPEMTLDPWSGY